MCEFGCDVTKSFVESLYLQLLIELLLLSLRVKYVGLSISKDNSIFEKLDSLKHIIIFNRQLYRDCFLRVIKIANYYYKKVVISEKYIEIKNSVFILKLFKKAD